ncbi:chloride channel [Phakopsora pachyrhizi]|uniref:Chloride channel n=1 Tax=Phakopsora pachyrhizi TaxID=170000 RepID=A0AAV0BQX0_PHAPC|nr:chloride channel [Phakopsora pachyrhizi]CAH7688589.1 chloride channel [Phakopsora pachyrhizi]
MRTPTSRKRNDFIAGDDRLQIEMISQTGNGIRVWYESYCSIDWLHELIKESIRRKKLAQLGGLRGVLNRCWDRSQAWVLVTLIGVFTGLLASMITSAEIYLYDFKDGYCSRSWFTAKRFCCRSEDESTSQLNSESLVLTLASIFNQSNLIPLLESPSKNILMTANNQHLLRSPAFSKRSFLSRQWSSGDLPIIIPSVMNNSSIPASLQLYEIRPQSCPDWRRWSDLWSSSPSTTQWTSKLVFIFISLALAGLSSVLTVYFSRSTTVISNSIEPKITKSQTGLNEGLMSESSRSPDLDDIPSQASLSLQTKKVSYFASGSGIPEIKCILSGFVIVGYLGAGTLIVKSVALALVVSSGLSLGKEGPFVHIGSCMGNLFVRMFPKFNRNEGKKREILSSACAAGIAAAFGAPIGGVLFSMEEVSYFFPLKVMWRSCWCTMVAVATLKALDPFRTGKTVLFEVTYDRSWHFVELNAFILLGIIGGVLGAFFAKANNWWSKNVRKISIISNHPIFEVLVISLVTSLLAFTDRFMKLGGTELVYEMLAECNLPDKAIFFTEGACTSDPQVTGKLLYRMGITATLKYLITVITFGTKVPAGVFIPSLVIGGLIGRMMGLTAEYFHYVYPDLSIFSQCDPSRPFGEACIVPGVWAMVGATAMLAGVTRTAVALVVIIAELTGSLTYILPIAVGVLVAKTTADVIERRSIYDFAIENLELPFLDAKTDYLHYVQPCDVMDSEVEVIDLGRDIRVSDLRKLLGSSKFSRRGIGGFPIIEKLGEIRRAVGYIGITELEHALIVIDREGGDPICSFSGSDPDYEIMEFEDQIDLGHLVDRAPVTVSVNSATELIHEMFVRLGVRYLIIQYENGSYAGIIEKKR